MLWPICCHLGWWLRNHHPSISWKGRKKGPRCWYGESTDHRSTILVVKLKQSHGFQSNGLYVCSYIYYDIKKFGEQPKLLKWRFFKDDMIYNCFIYLTYLHHCFFILFTNIFLNCGPYLAELYGSFLLFLLAHNS